MSGSIAKMRAIHGVMFLLLMHQQQRIRSLGLWQQQWAPWAVAAAVGSSGMSSSMWRGVLCCSWWCQRMFEKALHYRRCLSHGFRV
jgi:hypothetical protein